MKNLIPFTLLLICLSFSTEAQYTTANAHSHNDYENDIPFRLAYGNHFGSIEADVWAVNGELFIAHYETGIKPGVTLDSLYIQPIVKIFQQNNGKAWMDHPSTFQLLIDLKTAAEPTLSLLIEKLKKYPDVFNPRINKGAVRIVISGNRPETSYYLDYPRFIYFDGLLDQRYNKRQLKRIPLFSENLKKYTLWNGEGDIIEKDKIRLQIVIDSIHAMNKKIRFWNAPDGINAWKTFINMGIDQNLKLMK
jgi:alkaline phosphatase